MSIFSLFMHSLTSYGKNNAVLGQVKKQEAKPVQCKCPKPPSKVK